jgi:hypothetical protein
MPRIFMNQSFRYADICLIILFWQANPDHKYTEIHVVYFEHHQNLTCALQDKSKLMFMNVFQSDNKYS